MRLRHALGIACFIARSQDSRHYLEKKTGGNAENPDETPAGERLAVIRREKLRFPCNGTRRGNSV